MKAEMKARWVAALRSDEYTQTRGQLAVELRGVRSHCCLGVICELNGLPARTIKSISHIGSPLVYGMTLEAIDTIITATPSNQPMSSLTTYEKTSGSYLPSELHNALNLGEEKRISLPFKFRPDSDGFEDIATLAGCNDNGITFPRIADLIEHFISAEDEQESVEVSP